MFEVIRTGPPFSTGALWWRKTQRPVTLRATEDMSCEYLVRTFQGHGNYTTQTYRVDVAKGDAFTFAMEKTALRVGDFRALETIVGEGFLREYARLVATT